MTRPSALEGRLAKVPPTYSTLPPPASAASSCGEPAASQTMAAEMDRKQARIFTRW